MVGAAGDRSMLTVFLLERLTHEKDTLSSRVPICVFEHGSTAHTEAKALNIRGLAIDSYRAIEIDFVGCGVGDSDADS